MTLKEWHKNRIINDKLWLYARTIELFEIEIGIKYLATENFLKNILKF